MRRWVLCTVLVLASSPGRAQTTLPDCNPEPKAYRDFWCFRVREILEARQGNGTRAVNEPLATLMLAGAPATLLARFALKEKVPEALLVEES